ncbi:hypothetical protein QD460_05480 [Rhizobium jaguaris]|uniref:hypothetical protein n=1 Tax=Rhizobium jaguaris TaxID=1312183 RepID=UPI001FE02CF4|nr:hypothetical protein [Rhizobium jaguaris]
MRPRAAGDFRRAAGFALAMGMAVVALTSVIGGLDFVIQKKNGAGQGELPAPVGG